MSTLGFTGFECGGAIELPAGLGSGQTISTAIVRTGVYALKADSSQYTETALITGLSETTMYARIYVFIDHISNPGSNQSGALMAYRRGDGQAPAVVEFFHQSDGGYTVRAGALGGATTGFYSIAAGTQICVELKCVVSSTVGVVEFRLNGVVQETLTNIDTGASPIVSVNVAGSLYTTPQTGLQNVYMDDFLASNSAYPGNGGVIARQGKAGSPTYDAWTKIGDTTAALCWSETPYSASKSCSSAGASQAQTMLVADIGAGTNPIGAADTINACRVVGVGKYNGTASARSFYRSRRRVGGSDTDEDVTGAITSTTDAVFRGSIFTATRTDLQSAEIGGVVGTGGGTRKELIFEDLWLMVDYTPAPVVTGGPFPFYFDELAGGTSSLGMGSL